MLRFELVLFLIVGTCVTMDITSKRKQVLLEASVVVLNTLHYCHSYANYTKPTLDDAMMFWNMAHPLMHTELGCAGLCVGIMLHLTDLDTGDIHLPHARAFLKYKNADDEMIKIMYDLGLYCRNSISMLNVTVEPCWIGLEYLRCVRDGINDLGWIPDPYNVNKAYSDFLVKVNKDVGKTLPPDKIIKIPHDQMDTPNGVMRRMLRSLQPIAKDPKKNC